MCHLMYIDDTYGYANALLQLGFTHTGQVRYYTTPIRSTLCVDEAPFLLTEL
jgi:hypothetical protein